MRLLIIATIIAPIDINIMRLSTQDSSQLASVDGSKNEGARPPVGDGRGLVRRTES